MRGWKRIAPVLLPLAVVYLFGCSKNPTRPVVLGGPQTELTYAPPQSDTTTFRVHLYWNGWVDDGEIVRYRIAVDGDTAQPILKWHATPAHDSEFTFLVRPGATTGGHVFWVSAEARDGRYDPTPAKRFFSVHTVPPLARIVDGPHIDSRTAQFVTFTWAGQDPDGGPTGLEAPADSFEYILLRPGTSFDGTHPVLPGWPLATWASFLTKANGPSLPPPYDDWKWTGTRSRSETFSGLVPGWYVFAVRAVDAAGAHDAQISVLRNVRSFAVASTPDRQSPPKLQVSSDALTRPVAKWDAYGNVVATDVLSTAIKTLQDQPVRFYWTAAPGDAAYTIAGYTTAVDDTTSESWDHPVPEPTLTIPAGLTAGRHHIYIRALDTSGGFSLADITLDAVRAAFRDPLQPPAMLYVDDFAAPPGTWAEAVRGSPNFPTDGVEDDWWTRGILAPIAQEHGFQVEQWDPVMQSATSLNHERVPPPLEVLAEHRVVIWSVDFNNVIDSPTGLWSTLASGEPSDLRQYVRGGGTLILTGFSLSASASYSGEPYRVQDLCGATSTVTQQRTWFERDIMGVKNARSSDMASRAYGARDFVLARATSEGFALGFQSAEVDTGSVAAAKWDPLAWGFSDGLHAPGLPKIDGWSLQASFGCRGNESAYGRENSSRPIATPLFTYHGVNEGLLENGASSPREDLVIGIATQAHDDGNGDGTPVTTTNTRGVIGRMVFLGFPIYYMKDAQALQVMRAAFAYVNASPTLPAGTP